MSNGHQAYRVTVQAGNSLKNMLLCEQAPDLDMYTEIVSQNGDLFVYECTDISVAEDLIDYLRGMLDMPAVVGNPR